MFHLLFYLIYISFKNDIKRDNLVFSGFQIDCINSQEYKICLRTANHNSPPRPVLNSLKIIHDLEVFFSFTFCSYLVPFQGKKTAFSFWTTHMISNFLTIYHFAV